MVEILEVKRYGNQNPTKSKFLEYEKSYGENAIQIYEKTNQKLLPWQKNLIEKILAINRDGLYTHQAFGFAVPRQNGKNEIIATREIYGLINGERIMHTAHRVATAHSAWERLVRLINKIGFVEDEDFKTLKAKGQERIEFIDSGGRVEFRTRTSTGGLGESFDLLIIDEAQEYTEDQETALKYMIAASENPQTILCGTPPTMVSGGTIFPDLRKSVFDGISYDTGWAEWSVEHESDVNNVDLWYKTNPTLGYFLTERTIRREITGDNLDFNIQRLGYWVEYNQKSAITKEEWEKLKVNNTPIFKSGLYVGIKYDKTGKSVSMGIAVKTYSDRIFVEAIDCRPMKSGNQWIINYLLSMDIEKVIVDGAGYQKILKDEMLDFGLKEPILPTVSDVILANSKFEKAVFEKEVWHNDQPSLSEVVTNCEKRLIGTQGGFGYKSQLEEKDITLMDSVILAYHVASIKEEKKKKQLIIY